MRIFCLILMIFGIGACDQKSGTAQMSPAMSCGEIVIVRDPVRIGPADPPAARQAAQCFVQAYQSCTPTTLTFHDPFVEMTWQFSVTADSPCILREIYQNDPGSPPAVADCENVRLENDEFYVHGCSHLGEFSRTLK